MCCYNHLSFWFLLGSMTKASSNLFFTTHFTPQDQALVPGGTCQAHFCLLLLLPHFTSLYHFNQSHLDRLDRGRHHRQEGRRPQRFLPPFHLAKLQPV
jgi:hypothetical protein